MERINVLVTGAKGFAGRNLVEALKCVRDGKDRTRPGISIGEIFEYDLGSSREELDRFAHECGFAFCFAGVNRPKDPADYMPGNLGAAEELLNALKKHANKAPVMLASSAQASLAGRFGRSEYGLSKRAAEDAFFRYAEKEGVRALVYRFPNLAGKWIRPNYNSAVGTFCHNIANSLPVTVNDPEVELELLFIDDLVDEMFRALEGKEHRCFYPGEGETVNGVKYDGLTPLPDPKGDFSYCPVTNKAKLGRIVELLELFRSQPETLVMPAIAPGSFEKKLYSMYLSYLPKERVAFDLKMNIDERGSFTEVLKTVDHGQFSVNISKPGVTKGRHWHNSKWELFIVVSGSGLIRERRIGSDEVLEFRVSGERITAVHMLPGYTHEIINLSETEDLVTLMWANEIFDKEHPDTFFENV